MKIYPLKALKEQFDLSPIAVKIFFSSPYQPIFSDPSNILLSLNSKQHMAGGSGDHAEKDTTPDSHSKSASFNVSGSEYSDKHFSCQESNLMNFYIFFSLPGLYQTISDFFFSSAGLSFSSLTYKCKTMLLCYSINEPCFPLHASLDIQVCNILCPGHSVSLYMKLYQRNQNLNHFSLSQ